MRRIILLSLICLFAIKAPAVLPDSLASIPHAIESLSYHLRLAPLKNRSATCTTYWNINENGDYKALEFTIPSQLDNDPQLGFEARYKYIGRYCDVDTVYCSGNITSHYSTGEGTGFSFVLKANPDGAAVLLGGANTSFTMPVEFTNSHPGKIGYECQHPLKELRNTVRYKTIDEPAMAPFTSEIELREYIKQSENPLETYWAYLDRDIKPEKAHIGGFYTLATVATTDGSYIIVYIDGAENGAKHWEPLRIKGRLKPTDFENHFTLEWYDAASRSIDKETSADILLNNTVLRLNFPLYEASVRFSRMSPK